MKVTLFFTEPMDPSVHKVRNSESVGKRKQLKKVAVSLSLPCHLPSLRQPLLHLEGAAMTSKR